MAQVVLYDATVLYGGLTRDLAVRVGIAGLVQAKWTEKILDEAFGNLLANRKDLSPARLKNTRKLMNDAVRDCLVTGYGSLIGGLKLPDPGDRHVLAAAIQCGAQVIVTDNTRHFPAGALKRGSLVIEAQKPDKFFAGLVVLDGVAMWRILDAIAGALRTPDDREGMLARLRRNGLKVTASELDRLKTQTV